MFAIAIMVKPKKKISVDVDIRLTFQLLTILTKESIGTSTPIIYSGEINMEISLSQKKQSTKGLININIKNHFSTHGVFENQYFHSLNFNFY